VQGTYDDILHHATHLFVGAILEREDGLVAGARLLDGDLRPLLVQLGLLIVEMVFARLSRQLVAACREDGFTVEERKTITVPTIYGEATVAAPYLRDRATGRTARPVVRQMGLRHRQRTLAMERALTDFGAEVSFARAAAWFEEHYHVAVEPSTLQRVTKHHARAMEAWVSDRLRRDVQAFEQSLAERPGVDALLVELDGCEIRTGVLIDHPDGGVTEGCGRPRKKRVEAWREVRVGLVRELEAVEKTYIARMDGYPAVVEQLFAAAVGRGLSDRTQVVAVSDGGNGLKEALAVGFSGLQFILDQPHLTAHLFEAAEAMGLEDDARVGWVRGQRARLCAGAVSDVLAELAAYTAVTDETAPPGQERLERLRKHLTRFADCVHYDAYKAAGWPIGSGEVESAHRQIPQQRLKIAGAFWHPDTINPMLALRIIRANGWWGDFWDHQVQQIRLAS